jgi:hypothetical protein
MFVIQNDTVISVCLTTLALILSWEIFDHLFGGEEIISHAVEVIKVPRRARAKPAKNKPNKESDNIVVSGSTGTITITPALIAAMAKKFPNESRTTLIRFLIARKASIKDAADMLEKSNVWRSANMPPPAAVTSAALGAKCIFSHGRALDGSPVIYFRGANYDGAAAPSMAYALAAANVIDQVVAPLEAASSSRVGESVTVLVHTAFVPGAINAPADIGFIKDFVQVLSDNYPERLKRLIVYPFPWYGRAIWQVVRPFLDPRTADKVALLPAGMSPFNVHLPLFTSCTTSCTARCITRRLLTNGMLLFVMGRA